MASLSEEASEDNLDEYPSKFRQGLKQAIQDQDTIGWKPTLKGYLTVKWRYSFTLGTSDTEAVHEGLGILGTKAIIKSLDSFAINLEVRMAFSRKSYRRAEIREMYSQPDTVPASDRHYCETTIGKYTQAPILTQTLATIHEDG